MRENAGLKEGFRKFKGRWYQSSFGEKCLYVVSFGGASILGGVFTAGIGAAVGSTGAAILKRTGHQQYNVKEAAQILALGSAIEGVPFYLLRVLLSAFSEDWRTLTLTDIFLSSGLELSAAAIGRLVLSAESSEMSYGESVASAAVGVGIYGGFAALVKGYSLWADAQSRRSYTDIEAHQSNLAGMEDSHNYLRR